MMRALLALIVALASLAVVPTRALAAPHIAGLGGDFNAFYCSGEALAQQRNPYLVEPLRLCEDRVQPNQMRTAGAVTPSPLPGYDLAFFAALSRLPYETAKLVWYAILLASIAVATVCLSRLTRFPIAFVLLALAPVDGILNLSFGQVPPIVVAALSLAAYLVQRGRYMPAAFAAAATLIEPHIGVPACLAMFIFLPGCRVGLAASAIVLGGVSVAATGFGPNVAYFTIHLPAQARGELVAADQFSLSAVLHLLHLPDKVALGFGTLSYLVMVGVGIWLGRYAARSLATEAFIVLVPAAAVLFAGTYVHDVQFAAALPAALLLCARERRRFAPWVVLAALLVPWFTYATAGHTLGLAVRVLCAIDIAWLCILATEGRGSRTRQIAIGGGVAAFAVMLVLCTVLPHRKTGEPGPIPVAFIAPEASAQENWGAYLRATPELSEVSIREEFEKLPLWLGVLGLLLLAADVPIVATDTMVLAATRGPHERGLPADAPVAR